MTKSIFVPCRPSFELGQIVATPGALETTTHDQRLRYLARHSIGDWGQVCGEDWKANDAAVEDGAPVGLGDDPEGVIAEAFAGLRGIDRIGREDAVVTTFLLPDEY